MKKLHLPVSILIVFILLIGCSPAQPTLVATSAATATQTVGIKPSKTVQLVIDTLTPTSLPATATTTLTPTPMMATATLATNGLMPPTQTEPAPIPALPGMVEVCNRAGFFKDMSYPPGSVVEVSTVFVKIWRLVNLGTCTWTPDYQIILLKDGQEAPEGAFPLGVNVKPGEYVDITMKVHAISQEGAVGGSYKLKSALGEIFGVGEDGNLPFKYLVLVKVFETAIPFQVTSVKVALNASNVSVTCPPGKKFIFTGKITVNDAGTVKYHWVFSDGSVTDDAKMEFTAAGTQSVTQVWTVGTKSPVDPNPFSGWVQLVTTKPNSVFSGRPTFNITCK